MDPHPSSPSRPSRLDWAFAGCLSAIAWLIYLTTLSPSLSYTSPDGNELATIPYLLGLAHPPGYPLYTWLGKVFTWLPVGDVAFRMNLMSATLGALAIGGLYLVSVQLLPLDLDGRRVGAGLSALLFAVGPTAWSQAVIAEVYAPNLAFVAATLLALLRWERTRRDRDFFRFALVFGLSLGMHLSDLGFAPGFALFVLLTDWRVLRRPTWWLAALAGFGLGISQFAWILLQSHRLDPRLLLGQMPGGLAGLYGYTLGSFSELKLAFGLAELPERLVVYLGLLRQELGGLAILVGVGGLVSLLLRRPRRFYLLVGMYLVHVWFFIQYRALDLEVFFLPAHFLWAVLLAFGINEILGAVRSVLGRLFPRGRAAVRIHGLVAVLLLLTAVLPLLSHWNEADHSDDVSIDDFYANAWEVLPVGSALLTPGGVFGYDAFYWQLIYDIRPDVLLPVTPSRTSTRPDLRGRALYSTASRQTLERRNGRFAPPAELVPEDLWMVPVLVGAQSQGSLLVSLTAHSRLTLYRLDTVAPALAVDRASPSIALNAPLGDSVLVGAELSPTKVESGGRIHLFLYWRVSGTRPQAVSCGLDGATLETHEIGFGNLDRYQAEVGPIEGKIVVEDFSLVVPSTVSAGTHQLTIGSDGSPETIGITWLTVVDEQGRLERWLSVAG